MSETTPAHTRLSWEDQRAIITSTGSDEAVALSYGVTADRVKNLRLGKRDPDHPKRARAQMTEAQREEVANADGTHQEVADRFGLPYSTVANLRFFYRDHRLPKPPRQERTRVGSPAARAAFLKRLKAKKAKRAQGWSDAPACVPGHGEEDPGPTVHLECQNRFSYGATCKGRTFYELHAFQATGKIRRISRTRWMPWMEDCRCTRCGQAFLQYDD